MSHFCCNCLISEANGTGRKTARLREIKTQSARRKRKPGFRRATIRPLFEVDRPSIGREPAGVPFLICPISDSVLYTRNIYFIDIYGSRNVSRVQRVLLAGRPLCETTNIYIHAVHAGRMGGVLNNEDIATVQKERDLYGHMTFMDSEVYCWCAAGSVYSSGAYSSHGSDG